MTVSTAVNTIRALGNGSATVFSFDPIVIFANADLQVYKFDAAGVETLLVEGVGATNYSVSVADYPGTGSITYPASGSSALVNGEGLVIRRVLDLVQETDFNNQGGYFPDTTEEAFDYAMMVQQQQQADIERSVKFNNITDMETFDPELPAPQANKIFAYNPAGDGFVNVDVPSQALVDEVNAAAVNAEASRIAAEAAEVAAEAAAALIPVPTGPADNLKVIRVKNDGSGDYELAAVSITADMNGPASSTSRAIALFDGTTGKLLKDGPALGTAGHVLKSAGAGADPAFGQVDTAGITDLAVTNAKIAANTIALSKMARVGTAGQVLYSGGAGADPAYGAPPAAGEVNTASNLGSGFPLFNSKSGVDLRFNSIAIGATRYVDTGSGSIYVITDISIEYYVAGANTHGIRAVVSRSFSGGA